MTFAPRYTVGELAGLAGLGIDLPPAVTRAVAALGAAERVRVPAPPIPAVLVRQAVTDVAAGLVRDAAASDQPVFDLTDVSAIGAARRQAEEAADRQALAAEVRDAAALMLGQTVAAHRGELIASIQAKHQATVTDLVKRARRLPAGATDESALEAGGQHRSDWISARDLVAELGRLRAALRLVDDGTPEPPGDGIEFCAAYERTGKLAETWLAPEVTTSHGSPGTLDFYLSAARDPGLEFWLPTVAEQAARIAELHRGRTVQRLQAAI
jgi:hypothetical protein